MKKTAASAGRKTLHTALILFYYLKDKGTPTWAKGVIVGAAYNVEDRYPLVTR